MNNIKIQGACECGTSKSGVNYITREYFAESGGTIKVLLENAIFQMLQKDCK